MSANDHEELPNNGWFDSEAELPRISSVDSTLAMGVNVISPFADQIQVRALDFGDSSATSPAPNRGIPVGNVPLGGTGPDNGEKFLDIPRYSIF